ncbi:efflux RND transporter periplasmic adaptor subunit [Morganella morganii]|uniref:efflux RND transporter periplasmic adaptor subunit n=1 Tax=Morganella morganii TaxID=582 RepID=UPI00236803D9|nr:efflux RND transporter periplasmic adaptor subunit [Morganella morganii]
MKNRILIVTTLFISSVSLTCRADEIRISVTNPQLTRSAPVLTLPGKFVAKNEIAIGSPLQQQTVMAVFVEEGQRVEKNQLLATLESPLQSAAVRQLQAETEKAAAYIRQQSVLAAQSQRDLSRMTKLAHSGVISASEFEKAKSETSAQRALVDAGRAELRQLQAQLAREQSQEDKSRVYAPAAGIISERHAVQGMLSDNSLLFKLIENGEIEFEATAGADELTQMQETAAVTMKTGNNRQLSGTVRFISPVLSSLTQSGRVRITVTDGAALRQGQTGVLTYTAAAREDRSLPYSAVRTGSKGERTVFIVKNNKVMQQPVQTGAIDNGQIAILSPLPPDADVVVNAQAFLTDNDTVIPVKAAK